MLRRFLIVWAAATLAASFLVHAWTRIAPGRVPSQSLQRWSMDALEAARVGQSLPSPPRETFTAQGPVITSAWWRGKVVSRHVGSRDFETAIRDAFEYFRQDGSLIELPGWGAEPHHRVLFSVAVPQGEGPLVRRIPILSSLGIVPLIEGIRASFDGRSVYVTPHEIWSTGLLDGAVVTPIPDLSFGTDVDRLLERAAADLDTSLEALAARGEVRRFRAFTITRERYPGSDELTAEALEQGAKRGAEFLLRHQRRSGRYVYIYDAQRDRRQPAANYSMPRHSGATFFLAQLDRVLDFPPARKGALRALRWVKNSALHSCGGPDRLCVGLGNRVDLGSTALTALSAAELLRVGDDVDVREMLVGMTGFMRSMQRPDGEMMHDYDRRRSEPIDVQHMYYSGEAAYALLRAHRVMADDRDLETVRRLMNHLTGRAWTFFGSRYFYGEEHWTCQAVPSAADRLDVAQGLEFCERWMAFQRNVQYAASQTPWPVEGAYGVGPLLVPRITAIAARGEAGAQIYRAARDAGHDTRELRAQIEAGLRAILRFGWTPGPVHLFARPDLALGGIPATQAGLSVRNDFIQHAGSAMTLWAEILAEEGR